MKKSIAVLSLSLASLLGLAACAPSVKAPVASGGSASASASASPSASPSASSESSSRASYKPTSSVSARETASSSSTEGLSSLVGADEMKYNARKLYETYYQETTDAEKDPTVAKSENADGKTLSSYTFAKDGKHDSFSGSHTVFIPAGSYFYLSFVVNSNLAVSSQTFRWSGSAA